MKNLIENKAAEVRISCSADMTKYLENIFEIQTERIQFLDKMVDVLESRKMNSANSIQEVSLELMLINLQKSNLLILAQLSSIDITLKEISSSMISRNGGLASDILRLKNIALEMEIFLSDKECYLLWEEYSASLDAQWLVIDEQAWRDFLKRKYNES